MQAETQEKLQGVEDIIIDRVQTLLTPEDMKLPPSEDDRGHCELEKGTNFRT